MNCTGVSGVCIWHSHVSSQPSGPVSTSSAPHTLCAPSPRQRPLADLRSHSARSVWSRMTDRMWTCRRKRYNEKNTTYNVVRLFLFPYQHQWLFPWQNQNIIDFFTYLIVLEAKKTERHDSYSTEIKTIWSFNLIFAKNIQFH